MGNNFYFQKNTSPILLFSFMFKLSEVAWFSAMLVWGCGNATKANDLPVPVSKPLSGSLAQLTVLNAANL